MSRKAEQRLWDTMKRQKEKTLKIPSKELFHRRIENRVDVGMPDSFWKPVDFDACWTELKAPVIVPNQRPGTRLFRGGAALSPEQVAWAIEYGQAGGRWYLVARDSEKQLYLFHWRMAREINTLSTAEARAARIADNWKSIFEMIRGGWHEA